jgi:hypothetical protein
MERERCCREYFRGNRQIDVTYEDFVRNVERVKGRIIAFLDLDDCEMELPPLSKIGSETVSDDITNFEEVCIALRRTEFAEFVQCDT